MIGGFGREKKGGEVIEWVTIDYLVGSHCPEPGRSVGFASRLGSAQNFETLLAFSLFCFLALISLNNR